MILLGWVGTPEILLLIILGLFIAVTFWKLFVKAGNAGYTALIPIYNGYKLFDMAGKGKAFILVLILQIVNGVFGRIIIESGQPVRAIISLIVLIIVSIITIQVFFKLSVCFGKNKWFGLGLFFLPFIFFPILAFDKSKYQKPGSYNQTLLTEEDVAVTKNKVVEQIDYDKMKTGVEVRLKFFSLAFVLNSVTPIIEINGVKEKKKWGTHFFKIPPGDHIIKIYFPYMGKKECGANQIRVLLEKNEIKKISFYMPPWMFARGKIKITGNQEFIEVNENLEFSSKEINMMECPECGNSIPDVSIKCKYCKSKLLPTNILNIPDRKQQSLELAKGRAQKMYVIDLLNISDIADKLNLTTETINSWKNTNKWEELRVNKHKDKLITHIIGKITANPNNSLAAFQAIFIDIETEPVFTDNEMMAGLKHIALNHKDQKQCEFATKIMKEGNKSIEDINIEINDRNT